jgi:catechol 2,3-dioxygenase-like lactoylglutathione lyase family enzyme
MSSRTIGRVALVVRDYDEAIAYYTTRLRVSLIEDTPLGDGKRWVQSRGGGKFEPKPRLVC